VIGGDLVIVLNVVLLFQENVLFAKKNQYIQLEDLNKIKKVKLAMLQQVIVANTYLSKKKKVANTYSLSQIQMLYGTVAFSKRKNSKLVL